MDEPVPVPTPSKPFPLLSVILSILVALSLSSTAYLAYQNMQLTKQIQTFMIEKLTPTPTPTPYMVSPTPTCRPRPPCLDSIPRCMIPETSDMCPPTQKTACTMEAKLCPDGSAVGRTGPNCEFALCPTP